MTSRLLAPWPTRRRAAVSAPSAGSGSTRPTPILDLTTPSVRALAHQVAVGGAADDGPRSLLRRAHRVVGERVRPVYAVDDRQPVSVTLRRGRGSCSQRMALLEAVARASGVATRVEGLGVDGRFWYPRFPRLHWAVPDVVVLAWPEFRLDDAWVPISRLFDHPDDDAATGFTNADGETLYDAVGRTEVRWEDASAPDPGCSTCDLSATVLHRFGHFDDRDDLFAAHGQTLCAPARTFADPVLSRWSAGAA